MPSTVRYQQMLAAAGSSRPPKRCHWQGQPEVQPEQPLLARAYKWQWASWKSSCALATVSLQPARQRAGGRDKGQGRLPPRPRNPPFPARGPVPPRPDSAGEDELH
jgi:hypothetical protein